MAHLVELICLRGGLGGIKDDNKDNEEENTSILCTREQEAVVTAARLALGRTCTKDQPLLH